MKLQESQNVLVQNGWHIQLNAIVVLHNSIDGQIDGDAKNRLVRKWYPKPEWRPHQELYPCQ